MYAHELSIDLDLVHVYTVHEYQVHVHVQQIYMYDTFAGGAPNRGRGADAAGRAVAA